ncbi:MAG: ATP-dependent zinc metalloprotease FtsH [Acutalibacteraceae bacterium]|nr:ATP-dependent zinc metalloprotease FtsH [Acutalibacteraceae bacterium]
MFGIVFPILILLIAGTFALKTPKDEYKYSEIMDMFEQGQVESFELKAESGELKLKVKDKTEKITFSLAYPQRFLDDVKEYINTPDSKIKYDIDRSVDSAILWSVIPNIGLIVILIVIWIIIMKRMSGGFGADKSLTFGKARVKNSSDGDKKNVFDDVAGADEEKEELQEIVEFLKNPDKFNTLGARIPKGVLLMGPPGTGKTLLARAVAGEAGVPFFSISGSDFVEMFVGVGASRVRDLFEQAKKNAPCIIFIDEIDSVGRQRGTGLGGGHDEREQTLNQLLVEMDGFDANIGVIMIAATNRPDILDPALMRPGRFDRQIVVGRPDIKGREEILKVHAKNKPLAPDVELKVIAQQTAGFTGADLENILNEAALLAARRDRKAITMNEIEEATVKVVVGTEKRSKVMTDKNKRITAYHETGHAIAHYFCETQDDVHQISIIPRGFAGGYTMSLPSEDKMYNTYTEMKEEIIVLLGGRVAEQLIFNDISTGASNDIERATDIARSMITKYGMSKKLGPITFGESSNEVFIGRDMGHVKNYSEKIAAEIDEEIFAIVKEGYEKVTDILSENIDKLHEVAKILLEKEKLSGEEFTAIMKGEYDPDKDYSASSDPEEEKKDVSEETESEKNIELDEEKPKESEKKHEIKLFGKTDKKETKNPSKKDDKK